jgi:clan AA aspartic protease (TIGR02281 family)
VFIVVAGPGRADVVKLKNGKTMEGIVTGETDAEVTINIGVGEVKLKRAQVASIERTGAEGRAAMEQEWQRHFFTHKNYVPKGWEDIARDFSGLEKHRQEALRARKQVVSLKADITKSMASIRALEKEYVGAAAAANTLEDPTSFTTKEQFDAYNRVVGARNTISSQKTLKQAALANAEEALAGAVKVPADYRRALAKFGNTYRERVVTATMPTNHVSFFREIDTRLAGFEAEWKQYDVAFEGTDHAMYVNVLLNDTVSGRFLLDTGASSVTLSPELAGKLGLDTAGQPTVSALVADGRSVEAVPVLLKSVQVGDARAEHVGAMVLPQGTAQDIDGLLGMTFLREFELHVDATGHRIELKTMK